VILVSDIADKLASPMHVKHLMTTLNEKNIKTVRDLNKLSETDISNLPIKEPKWASVKAVLNWLKVIFINWCSGILLINHFCRKLTTVTTSKTKMSRQKLKLCPPLSLTPCHQLLLLLPMLTQFKVRKSLDSARISFFARKIIFGFALTNLTLLIFSHRRRDNLP
jgi:hypothetical protein